MIKIGSTNYDDLNELSKHLFEVNVTFSFWKGRRFNVLQNQVRLNDIISAVKKACPTLIARGKQDDLLTFVEVAKIAEGRGYSSTQDFSSEHFENKNIFIRFLHGLSIR